MRAQSTRIAYIDGWRVIAIALVFLDHLGMNREISGFYSRSLLGFISEYGEVGVFIFFFISGYVVSLACLNEIAVSGDFSAAAFYARRMFRIAPPLILYLGFCLRMGATKTIDFSFDNFLSSALYLCNTAAPFVSCNWYVGHTWSLAFEEQFYLLFPFVFSFLELGRKPKPLAVAITALVISAPFFFTIWWIGKTGFLIAYLLFFAGYAAAKQGDRIMEFFGASRGPALLLSTLIVFLPRCVIASLGDTESARAGLIAYYRFFYVAAIPAMVLLSGATSTILRDILSNRPLAYLGRASYSIYLWQQICNGPVFNGLGIYAQLGLLSGMVIGCIILFELVEMKLIGLGRAISARLQRPGGPQHIRSFQLRTVIQTSGD